MPPSYADATETELHQQNLPPSYSQCVILHENPPSYSEVSQILLQNHWQEFWNFWLNFYANFSKVYGRSTSTSLVLNSCDILKSEKVWLLNQQENPNKSSIWSDELLFIRSISIVPLAQPFAHYKLN